MNNVLTIIGIVLAVAGAIVSAFAGIPVADLVGIAVAMVGAGLACTGVVKKSNDEGKNKALTITSVVLVAVGAFLMACIGIPESTVTQIITVVAGLVSLIAGLFISRAK